MVVAAPFAHHDVNIDPVIGAATTGLNQINYNEMKTELSLSEVWRLDQESIVNVNTILLILQIFYALSSTNKWIVIILFVSWTYGNNQIFICYMMG